MATWSSSSSAADPRALPVLRDVALGAAALCPRHGPWRGMRAEEIPLGPAPGRWSRAALLIVLVAVPGSMNLAVLGLPLLLVLGRLRRVRVWHARTCA